MLNGSKKSGASGTTMSASANLLVIQNYSSTKFIFEATGYAFADVEWRAFDDLDDVKVLNILDSELSEDSIKKTFATWAENGRELLSKHNIVVFNDDGHHFLNTTRLAMLHTGAIRQLASRLDDALDKIDILENKLKLLNS